MVSLVKNILFLKIDDEVLWVLEARGYDELVFIFRHNPSFSYHF